MYVRENNSHRLRCFEDAKKLGERVLAVQMDCADNTGENDVLVSCYSYMDPTGRLPEEIGILLDQRGVSVFSSETKQQIFDVWAWNRIGVTGIVEHEDDDEEDGGEDEMDLVSVEVRGIGEFQFECDDGEATVKSFKVFQRKKIVVTKDVSEEASAVRVSPPLAIQPKEAANINIFVPRSQPAIVDEVACHSEVVRSLHGSAVEQEEKSASKEHGHPKEDVSLDLCQTDQDIPTTTADAEDDSKHENSPLSSDVDSSDLDDDVFSSDDDSDGFLGPSDDIKSV